MNKLQAKTSASLSWLDELSPQRMITLAIILVILVVVAVFGIRYFRNWTNSLKVKRDLKDYEKQSGETPSFSNAEYTRMANEIEDATGLLAALNPSNQTKILNVFYKMNNTLDLKKLEAAFGVRSYVWGGNFDLRGILQREVFAANKKKINNMLAAKDINWAI